MVDNYSTICSVIWIALAILCALVHENSRIPEADKKRYYLTYGLIFVACLAEFTGLKINGNENVPVIVLRIVKCIDYIFTPLAGLAFIGQLKVKGVFSKILNVIVAVNALFQIVCIFTDWMLTVDEHHVYSHGQFYIVYVVEYLAIISLVVVQFLRYGKGFKKQNRFSLYLIMLFVLYGIIMQEIGNKEIKTAYLTLAFGACMMFIHISEFSSQRTDEFILEQQIQIKTDALTGLLSRYAYSFALNNYKKTMPADFVAFSIDVNGLKQVNDTLGHEAGDELICGAARCIEKVFGNYGSCYRTGGDEFIVLASMEEDVVLSSIEALRKETAKWKGKKVSSLSLSIGYSMSKGGDNLSCEALVRDADKGMYEDKEEYYLSNGISRRTR